MRWTAVRTRLLVHQPTHQGLTLVELLVVLVLMGLLAATAAVQVRQPLAEVRKKQAIAQLRNLDALARDRARQDGAMKLVIDIQNGSARLMDEAERPVGMPVSLHPSMKFHSILGGTSFERSSRLVRYDRFGTSSTFAVSLGSANVEGDWLLVLGMTGQTYQGLPRERIDAIMRAERNHSD